MSRSNADRRALLFPDTYTNYSHSEVGRAAIRVLEVANVHVEPSDAVMLQSDCLDLLSGEAVESVAANTYGVCEYLDAFGLKESIDFAVSLDFARLPRLLPPEGGEEGPPRGGSASADGVRRRPDPLDVLWDGRNVRLRGRTSRDEYGYWGILVDQLADSPAAVVAPARPAGRRSGIYTAVPEGAT